MSVSIQMTRQGGWLASSRQAIIVCMFLAVLTGCSTPTATPLPFSKEQAIARATQDAKQSVPEVGIQQARIDSVTAELITLGEADTRTGGGRGPGGYAPGQTPQSPVWWVSVRGCFQYEGMGAPPNPAPVCQAEERDFIYDAQTGESIGASIRDTRCAVTQLPFATATRVPTATAAPIVGNLPTATIDRTPVLITRLTATPTPTPNSPLPILSPTATPTCPPPLATPTTAPTSALNPPAAGSLDPTFGTGGTVLGYNGSGAIAMAIQPDGKIVTVASVPSGYGSPSRFLLQRFNADGSIDCSFGNRGAVAINPYGDDHELSASGVALQADGRILVVGTIRNDQTGDDVALVRLNADGSLDRASGDGGQVSVDLDHGNDWPRAVAIQSDSSIVVSGRSTGGEHAADALSLARFRPDGSLDPNFGQGGRVISDMNRHGDGRALVIQSDGKIVVAGSGNSDIKMFNFALLRYNSDGSFDPSFGNKGIVLTPLGKDYDGANAMALQPDGKLVVAGQSSVVRGRSTLAVRRYNSDGSLDPSFASIDLIDLPYSSAATAVAIQADGKIVVTGNISPPDGFVSSMILRFHSDGSPDSTFGSGGRVVTRPSAGDNIRTVAIQADGKILVAGTTMGPPVCPFKTCNYPNSLLLLRYLP